MSNAERDRIISLALGRIFRLYAAHDAAPFAVGPDHNPNHTRDRNRGAAGS